MMNGYADGYYWARHQDNTTFVVFHEDGRWYCCGATADINRHLDTKRQIICPIIPAEASQ